MKERNRHPDFQIAVTINNNPKWVKKFNWNRSAQKKAEEFALQALNEGATTASLTRVYPSGKRIRVKTLTETWGSAISYPGYGKPVGFWADE